MSIVEDADLPKALVKRIVKAKLAQLEDHAADGSKKEFQLNKDALLAFAESAKVFINYITAAANDACKEAKRQTMNPTDVLTALEELQFGELIPGVKDSLEALKEDSKTKSIKKSSDQKKRKSQPEKRDSAGPQHKKPVGFVPATASGGMPQLSPAAVPIQHLAAVPNVAQSLMLQQLAQLSPQQQQQYVLAAQRAAQQQALMTAQAPGFAAGHQAAPQHAAAMSGAIAGQTAFLPGTASATMQFPVQRAAQHLSHVATDGQTGDNGEV